MILFKDRITEADTQTQQKQPALGVKSTTTPEQQTALRNQFKVSDPNAQQKVQATQKVQTQQPQTQQTQTPQQQGQANGPRMNLDPSKKYVYIDANGQKYNIQFNKNGEPYYLNGKSPIPCKDFSTGNIQIAQDVNASSNNMILKYFKDGDMKTRLSLRSEPFTKITLSGGNIVVESRNSKTSALNESLSLDIPDYLYKMREETYTAPLGATNLNWMLSDKIQQILQSQNKDILQIDCSSGEPLFIDNEGNKLKISDLKQMISNQESQDVANNNVEKMSKNDLSQITTAVVNQLNAKLSKVKTDKGTYKVQWTIDNTGFDPKTLKEGLIDKIKSAGNKIGDAIGTQASKQRNMTNGSVSSPFRVKAIVIDTETGKEVKEESVYQALYKNAAKIMPSVNVKSTDENGNQYDTVALIKAQPYSEGGLFSYQAQMNVGHVDTSEVEAQQQQIQQQADQQIKDISTPTRRQQKKINKIQNNANSQKAAVKKKKPKVNFAPTAHKTTTKATYI